MPEHDPASAAAPAQPAEPEQAARSRRAAPARADQDGPAAAAGRDTLTEPGQDRPAESALPSTLTEPHSAAEQDRPGEPAVRDTFAGPAQDEAPGPGQQSGVKLGVFVGGLAVALVAGFGLAKVITPPTSPTAGAQTGAPAPQSTSDGHVHGPQAAAGSEVGGLALSTAGYTVTPLSHQGGALSFVVNGPDGKPVTDFATVHEKPLHLIVVRRDLTRYQHLHPVMAADGTWSVQADLSAPGVWRVFADFTVAAATGAQTALTLGYDITVPGDYQPEATPPAAREATMDTHTVTYEGTPVIGATQPMLFRVFDNGAPVAGLEPYLGSFGHLVVLRDRDLAYVHVHPEPQLVGGAVKFWLAAPSPGTYRMFFDYQVGGKVRTAEFTLVVK